MTTTTNTIDTSPTDRVIERLRRVATAGRELKSAIAARWRAEVAAGSFGPDAETMIGRGTGARI